MPIHDWAKVDANLFHDFHQAWTISIRDALNGGLLPKGFAALAEQHAPALVPDVLALQGADDADANGVGDGTAVMTARPKTRHFVRAQQGSMAARGNRITIRHGLGRIVCVIEIVSPGNKNGKKPFQAFIEKSWEFLNHGVNLLIVDLFPPTPRDPQGIHKAIWDEIEVVPFDFDATKPLTLAAYVAGSVPEAFVESAAIGDCLPEMPAYLDEEHYVFVPLEATYAETWAKCPLIMRKAVEKSQV